jgi:hypothetical protein
MKDYDIIHKEKDVTTTMLLYYSIDNNKTILILNNIITGIDTIKRTDVLMLRILKTFCLDTAYIKLERVMKIREIKSKMNDRV